MQELKQYKQALKAYGKGFSVGAFTGIVICILLSKTVLMLPVVLGLLFGAIASERKLLKDGK